jgi:hypothetical protein
VGDLGPRVQSSASPNWRRQVAVPITRDLIGLAGATMSVETTFVVG